MYHRIYVCAQSLQSCPAHWDPMDCNLPGSSVHGILQARILEWVTMHFSRGSSSSRDQIQVFCFSCTASGFFLPTGPSGKPIQDIFLLLMLFSRQVVSNSLWSHRLWHARFPCPSPSPRVCPSSCQLNQWCHPTISSSVTPSPLAFIVSQHQGLFQWVGSSYQVAKVLKFQLQYQSFQWIFRTDVL